MIHSIMHGMTAGFNSRGRIEKIFDIQSLFEDDFMTIDTIVSDVVKSQLNGITEKVLAIPKPPAYNYHTSILLVDSKPVDLNDDITIIDLNGWLYIHDPKEDLTKTKEVMCIIAKGAHVATKGVGTYVGTDALDTVSETVIRVTEDGRFLAEDDPDERYVYMSIDFPSTMFTGNGTLFEDGYTCTGEGFCIDSMGKLRNLVGLDIINDHMAVVDNTFPFTMVFMDENDATFYKENLVYAINASVSPNNLRYDLPWPIDEFLESTYGDKHIMENLHLMRENEFGLYHKMLYKYKNTMRNRSFTIDELVLNTDVDRVDVEWDVIGNYSPKIMVPIYNPDGYKAEVFFNNRLITDYFHSAGGETDTIYIGIDKLFPELQNRNYDLERLKRWWAHDYQDRTNDRLSVSLKRADYKTHTHSFNEVNNGYVILPDGWLEAQDKRVYLNGLLLENNMYNIEEAMDGTLILFPIFKTYAGDYVIFTYHTESVEKSEATFPLSNHIEMTVGFDDEVWLGSTRLSNYDYDAPSSGDLVIFADMSNHQGEKIKVVSYENKNWIDSYIQTDMNYHLIRTDPKVIQQIHTDNLHRVRPMPNHRDKLPTAAYDVHMFYTLYGAFDEIVNLENNLPSRAFEILAPYLDESGVFVYDSNMDFIPRPCPVGGGEMEFVDAFYDIIYRMANDEDIDAIDANVDITDYLTDYEKEVFGEVIPTITQIMYREKVRNI